MKNQFNRRRFVQAIGTAGLSAALKTIAQGAETSRDDGERRYRFVQIDVFTSRRLEGNALAVVPDAGGLSDEEMQALARETNLQETTFVFPRSAAIERERGVKVRIFVPNEEIPFGGHPTLGTAMVLRNLQLATSKSKLRNESHIGEIVLDLQVGKIPVTFNEDSSGRTFGEMHQVDPIFGPLHERKQIASLLDLSSDDICADVPIQTLSTGLPFIIVPIKSLATLERLTLAPPRAYEYLRQHNLPKVADYYYVTRDTGDAMITLRARAIYPEGEDPATGSAAGSTAAWMVRHGIIQSDKTAHILQGVEIKRPSHIFVRASKDGETVKNVRVGGHAVQVMEGTISL
jgi:trans-2,3-dihydro-3-hydroxyanthranilate isomerase